MSKSLNTRFTRLPGQPSVLRQHIFRAPTRQYHRRIHTRFTFPDSRLFRQQVYSSVLPHASTHTDTRTHTTRRPCSSVPSSVVLLAALLWSFRPIVLQPLSPVTHASSIPSPENSPKRSEFRRLPSALNPPHPSITPLLVDLRLTQSVHIPPRRANTRLPVANPPLYVPIQQALIDKFLRLLEPFDKW